MYLELSEPVGLVGLDDMPTVGKPSRPITGIKPIRTSECPPWHAFGAIRTSYSSSMAAGGWGVS